MLSGKAYMTEKLPAYLGALTLIFLVGTVIARIRLMKSKGISAMKFGQLDRSDFLIPPFMLFYFYLVFANAFSWPSPAHQVLFTSSAVQWLGVLGCLAGLGMLVWSLVSFGQSFRVGIDVDRPGGLITSGAFAVSRNPIYVGFFCVLLGQFLIFPNWLLLVYLAGVVLLVHRQVRREEDFLKIQFGQPYAEYCRRVRRYL
jgi:protein-S-isoprenylcysteine O-methyltransferase Ste14